MRLWAKTAESWIFSSVLHRSSVYQRNVLGTAYLVTNECYNPPDWVESVTMGMLAI